VNFDNKVILITGAAGAIGKGLARRFCETGSNVFLTDLNRQALDVIPSEMVGLPGCCQARAADVTVHEDVKRVVADATAAFGSRIDVLVNVAGIVGQGGKIEDITPENWDLVFAANCKGTFLFIKEVVPFMKKTGGNIINFSSKSGKTGSALMSHYSAAKAAIIGLTQSLAYELAPTIRVNCVCPGITDNTGVWSDVSRDYVKNMHLPIDEVAKKFIAKVPLGRLATIEDIVAATTFLASDGAAYMTGQAINISGGREMH